MTSSTTLLLTCEHASRNIPKSYQNLFIQEKELLLTHEGWDIGAFECYQLLARRLQCESHYAKWSRLLIDLNRSLHHPKVFSKVTKSLPPEEKKIIINQYYQPYRDEIVALISKITCQNKQALHLSIHSFSPKLNGVTRKADIGLLYDPSRLKEKKIAKRLRNVLIDLAPNLTIRMNYPYKGIADGFTTHLRKLFNENQYSGLEIEINQNLTLKTKQRTMINRYILKSCEAII